MNQISQITQNTIHPPSRLPIYNYLVPIIFFGIFAHPAHAYLVNVHYINEYINTNTGFDITTAPGFHNQTAIASMKYLMSAIDKLNEISPYSINTNYAAAEPAVTRLPAITAVASYVPNLHNCKVAGGYKNGTKCEICPLDYYCPSGTETAISCNTVVPGYATDAPGAGLSSACHLNNRFEFIITSDSSSQYTLKGIDGITNNFIVNWGDGTINTQTASFTSLTHTYPSANTDYTIKIAGTSYNTDVTGGTSTKPQIGITFNGDTQIKSILTDYMNLYPNKNLSGFPARDYFLYQLLKGVTNITRLPDNFLSNVTGAQGSNFLYAAFNGSSLTSLPDNFLNGVTGAQGTYFLRNAFTGSKLTRLPDNFLSGVTGAQRGHFLYGAFVSNKLTSLPDNFLSGVTGVQEVNFLYVTFANNALLDKISLGAHNIMPPTGISDYFFDGTFTSAGTTNKNMNIWLWWRDAALTGMARNSMGLANASVATVHVPANLVTAYRGDSDWSNIDDAKFVPILCSEITSVQKQKFGAVPIGYCCTNAGATASNCTRNTSVIN